MCPNGYYTIMRESKDPRKLRLRMVQEARRSGVKPTARLFDCSPNTVRKWLQRFDGSLVSLSAMSRVLGEHGLVKRWRRRKHEVKRSLRHVKRLWRVFQQIEIDTKHLVDLPEYMMQAKAHNLPLYQYTARDVSTEALFLGYSNPPQADR